MFIFVCGMAGAQVVPLIGLTSQSFNIEKLPTGLEVLTVFFHFLKCDKRSKDASVKQAVELLMFVWNKTRFPVHRGKDIKEKLKKLIKVHSLLLKGVKTRSVPQIRKEREFAVSTNKLFDIINNKKFLAMHLSEDEKEFLADQRGERQRLIESVDWPNEEVEEAVENDGESDFGLSGKKDFLILRIR